jgi:hypothetical protein
MDMLDTALQPQLRPVVMEPLLQLAITVLLSLVTVPLLPPLVTATLLLPLVTVPLPRDMVPQHQLRTVLPLRLQHGAHHHRLPRNRTDLTTPSRVIRPPLWPVRTW